MVGIASSPGRRLACRSESRRPCPACQSLGVCAGVREGGAAGCEFKVSGAGELVKIGAGKFLGWDFFGEGLERGC